MFGFGFKDKVIALLKSKFSYQPGSHQATVLNEICKSAKLHGANEYDAAIMFMLVQMNSLSIESSRAKGFVDLYSLTAYDLSGFAKSPRNDIVNQLREVRAKHGLDEFKIISGIPKATKQQSFETWLEQYKIGCEEEHLGLGGLVEFMDLEPLRRAYRDGIAATELGRAFGKKFDLKKFGQLS